jgi:transposase-like protein
MTVEERRRRRFSEAFRKEQVALIESGKLTVIEVSRLYEVKPQNVRRWLDKYGTKALPEPILIRSKSEVNRLRELERENRKLKEELGAEHMRTVYLEGLVALAKERLGEDFEKK